MSGCAGDGTYDLELLKFPPSKAVILPEISVVTRGAAMVLLMLWMDWMFLSLRCETNFGQRWARA